MFYRCTSRFKSLKIKLYHNLIRSETILGKKSTLFSIVVVIMVGILAIPIIIPHILHGSHMAHIGLHIGGITLATFIALLAILAFSRLRTKRLLITSVAFMIFVAAECVLLIDATWPNLYDFEVMPLLEVGHLLTFGTLGVLALGVFRND
jgi:uncharacterized membrane protein YwaF